MIKVVRSAPPAHRLNRNGEHAFLVARSGGRPVLSMLTGVDRRFVRLAGERQGWFSCFEGEDDPEAGRALLREAAAFQRALGMERLSGPVAPDGRFLPGLPLEGPGAAPHLDRMLIENGFEAARELSAFGIPAGALPGLSRAAARARERHGVDTRRARFTREACRALYGLYEPRRLPFEEFAAWLEGMRPFELFLACVRGEDAGFALARRDGPLWRVETVMVAPRFRRGPALLCLLDALAERLGPRLVTGAIASDNAPARMLALAAGGAPRALWREYTLYLI